MSDPDFIDPAVYPDRPRPAETERAWAAGFFDGEGWVGTTVSKSGHTHLKLVVTQTELTALDRFNAATGGGGRIYERTKYQPAHWSPSWSFQVNQLGGVIFAVNMLWPYLCQPKRDQAAAAFAKRAAYRAGWPADFKLPQQRLTDEQIREIRALCADGVTKRADIATQFGVCVSSVYRVQNRSMRGDVA